MRNGLLAVFASLAWAGNIALVCGVVAAAGGCRGGDDFGFDVSVPQSRRQVFAGPLEAGRSMVLSADEPFNVADAQRRSDGPAQATSVADAHGTASCTADARHGGSAVAEFQLGHVIAYDGGAPFHATVTFDVSYECTLRSDKPHRGRDPIRLKAYVMDSDRRLLGEVMLADSDPDRLPTRWSGSQAPSFDVTFQPGVAYHMIVAGYAEATGRDTSGPLASVVVKSMAVRIAPAAG